MLIEVQGIDCTQLFSRQNLPVSFQENPKHYIPTFGSSIYTVWDRQGNWIYVGIGGQGQSPNTPLHKRNPQSRMIQHRSGRRSGDQFCIYVHDYYVVPNLDLKKYKFEKGYLDQKTKEFIQQELSYRFMVIQTLEGRQQVMSIETELKKGLPEFGKPLLNGV